MVEVCENLATKAELTELKEQINTLLGKKDDGGKIDVLEQGSFDETTMGAKLELIDEAVQDIEIHDNSNSPISVIDDLAIAGLIDGSNKFVAKKGGSVFKNLPVVTDQTRKTLERIFQNKEVGKVAQGSAKVSSNSIAILTSLASIVTSLALNILTVNTLGFRLDQQEKMILSYNQDYDNLIKLNKLTNNNFNKLSQELLKAKKIISDQQQINAELINNANKSKAEITSLTNLINQMMVQLQELQTQNEELAQRLEDFEGEATEDINDLKTLTSDLQTRLETSENNFENLLTTTEDLGIQLANLEGKITEVKDQLFQLSIQNSKNTAEINLLKKEIAQNKTITESKLKFLDARIILLEDQINKSGSSGGGFPVSAQAELAGTQTATLQLMNHLSSSPLTPSELTIEPYQLGFNNPFTNLFGTLLPQIPLNNLEITPLQFNEINTGINETIQTAFDQIDFTSMKGKITKIDEQTTPDKIKESVEDGICEQTKPGKCIDKTVKDNNEASSNDIINNFNLSLSGIFIPDFSSCDETLDCLLEIKDFLAKAWNSTTEDKKINVINNSLLLHNAMLLSQDISETLPKVTNFSLQNIEVTDYQENVLNISGKLTEVLQPFPDSISNLDNPLSIQSSLVNHNQIIQSSIGTMLVVENNKSSCLEATKLVGNYLSVIGNQMQIQGMFESETFSWLYEPFNLVEEMDGFLGQYIVSSNSIDNITDLGIIGKQKIIDTNTAIAENQEFIPINSRIEQLKADYNQTRQEAENTENLASLSPEIDRLDLTQLEPEEYGEE